MTDSAREARFQRRLIMAKKRRQNSNDETDSNSSTWRTKDDRLAKKIKIDNKRCQASHNQSNDIPTSLTMLTGVPSTSSNIYWGGTSKEARLRRKHIIDSKRRQHYANQTQTLPTSSTTHADMNSTSSATQHRSQQVPTTDRARTHDGIQRLHQTEECRPTRRFNGHHNIIDQTNAFTSSVPSGSQIQSLNFGAPKHSCEHCGALYWYEERSSKSKDTTDPKYRICCQNGLVQLPLLRRPPPILAKLMDYKNDKESQKFKENIRAYNSIFAFTSMGGKVDKTINNGSGPYIFRINGQNYHKIGSLLPIEGRQPKFAQLYIYDTENEVANRLTALGSTDATTNLDPKIVRELLEELDGNNALAKVFRKARDRFREDAYADIRIKLLGDRSKDPRKFNLPTASEVAALIIDDYEQSVGYRDIIIHHKDEGMKRITETHPSFMAMQYPLLFPYGEDGFTEGILYNTEPNQPSRKRECVTMCEFYAFRIQQRRIEFSLPIRGGRLFQQYIVDAYTCIEAYRLLYLRRHQAKLRTELYNGVKDAVARGDTDPLTVGKRIVLPSSFTNGPRYKVQNYQDAMAICRVYGNPDLFITFTANTKWPEIQSMLDEIPGQKVTDRPDIVARVFKIKLDCLMKDLTDGEHFGKAVAALYTIEFQKRGLPHAHIILFLHQDQKYPTAADIDRIISAEIPNEEEEPEAHAAVTQFMIHGPCGEANKKAPCMINGMCSKRYPKNFYNETTVDQDGFPIYRRRNNGRQIIKKNIVFDNRDVVPHNISLIIKYQAHINVEWCNQSRSIKYLFKYVHKGPDSATFVLDAEGDEIKKYLNCRYVSACEAIWRIYQFDVNFRVPSVKRLGFHLPNKQTVTFSDTQPLYTVLNRDDIEKTMFTEWFEANKIYAEATKLTYAEFPTKFVWHKDDKQWRPRRSGYSIGRVIYAHPTSGEHFYLRLLLNIVRGPKTFEDIRTFQKKIYPTFKAACYARGLLDGDKEWNDTIEEASRWATATQLRELFVTILLFCEVCEPSDLWNNHWKNLSDDILYQKRIQFRYPELQLSEEQIKNYALFEVEKLMMKNGKSLADYSPIPTPDSELLKMLDNRLITEHLQCNVEELAREHITLKAGLNEEQNVIYEKIIEAVDSEKGGLYFVHGYGGTGKTYLYKTIITKLRSEGKIVLAVASSGIAALLLPLGRTAHSRFEIPIDLNETSTCNIHQGTPIADLICAASLIIWDEAPMAHRNAFEAVDRTLKDILRFTHQNAEERVFGGKTFVLGGDFRQILPVVSKGRREDIVRASISKSKLWEECEVLTLTQNMRLTKTEGHDRDKISEFNKWLLSIGDGSVPTLSFTAEEEPSWIEIPEDLLISPGNDPIKAIISAGYPDLHMQCKNVNYLQERCILAPRNETVEKINDYIMDSLPGESKTYRSSDSICKTTGNIADQDALYPTEFLNTLKFSGIPHHELQLKVGTPIILLRNLNQSTGLCNGTRLIVKHLGTWVIEAEILTGKNIGAKVFIPRVIMTPTESKWPFTLKRRQFPIKPCYAMTINKSQGQTLKHVALYLTEPVFSHGQLYVGSSRVTSREGLKILIKNKENVPPNYTKNIVYKEIFADITP